jgi:hypothetical protein
MSTANFAIRGFCPKCFSPENGADDTRLARTSATNGKSRTRPPHSGFVQVGLSEGIPQSSPLVTTDVGVEKVGAGFGRLGA